MVDDEVEEGGPPGPVVVGRRSPEAEGGACRAPGGKGAEPKEKPDRSTCLISDGITGRSEAAAASSTKQARSRRCLHCFVERRSPFYPKHQPGNSQGPVTCHDPTEQRPRLPSLRERISTNTSTTEREQHYRQMPGLKKRKATTAVPSSLPSSLFIL